MEHDPLLAGGRKKISDHEAGLEEVYEPPSKTLLHATLLGIAPWLMFIAVLALMFEMYHYYTVVTMAILGSLIVLNVGFAVFEMAHGKKWLWWLGILCIVAIFAGCIAGQYNYYSYLLYYFSYNDLRKYTNVAPSQQAAGFGDAGMMLFTKAAGVDTTGAVGYQDAGDSGNIYCVAPIIDDSMTKTDMISFYAVGTNCCEERANFECGGAGDASAKSGLVILQVDKLVSEAIASVIGGDGDREKYSQAIKLQNAVFGTTTAKETVYVRWVKDPVALQDKDWQQAVHYVVVESALYFVLSLLMGVSAAFQARPKPKTLY